MDPRSPTFAALLLLTACDECVGSQRVAGVVRDQRGAALPGAVITQCWYDGSACRAATTDARGAFALEVQADGPASEGRGGCALRPLFVTLDGCIATTVRLDESPDSNQVDAGVVTLACP